MSWRKPVGFGNSDYMQFYLSLWIDSGLTLSQLGEWEEMNPTEFEAYMIAYTRKIREKAEAMRELEARNR